MSFLQPCIFNEAITELTGTGRCGSAYCCNTAVKPTWRLLSRATLSVCVKLTITHTHTHSLPDGVGYHWLKKAPLFINCSHSFSFSPTGSSLDTVGNGTGPLNVNHIQLGSHVAAAHNRDTRKTFFPFFPNEQKNLRGRNWLKRKSTFKISKNFLHRGQALQHSSWSPWLLIQLPANCVLGPLSPTWETQTELLAPGFGTYPALTAVTGPTFQI